MRQGQHADPAPLPVDEASDGSVRSLLGDVEALIDDARTFFDAELSFQKSRAGFVAGRVKLALLLGVGALFFAFMALFGLVVGLLLALTPLMGAWGAMAVVVGGLLLGLAIMAFKLRAVLRGMMHEIKDDHHG